MQFGTVPHSKFHFLDIICFISFLPVSVLPAFNVTLTPRKSFISLDDDELVVEISARSV